MLHLTGQLIGKPVKHGNLLVNRWSGKNLQFSALAATHEDEGDSARLPPPPLHLPLPPSVLCGNKISCSLFQVEINVA